MPIDNEASYLLKKVPVVTEEFASGTPQMARKVAETLKNYKIIMLRGHGRSGNLAPLRPAIPMCGGMLTPAIALIHKANSMAYKKAVVDA